MGSQQSSPAAAPTPPPVAPAVLPKKEEEKAAPPPATEREYSSTEVFEEWLEESAGFFRGLAAAARPKLAAVKVATKKAVIAAGTNRPLAFSSEASVAGQNVLPKSLYYLGWGLSGIAVGSDITLKCWAAPPEKQKETALYYTAFHVPASFLVPAYLIHQVVHAVEHSMEHHSYAKRLPARARMYAPVAAALVSIIPIVPAVDHAAEAIMEPTLGAYLGLEFDHHHPHYEDSEKPKTE